MNYAAVFPAIEITVSGPIKKGTTTGTITYFILDKSDNAVVGNIILPDASLQVNSFRMPVRVSRLSNFDVGTYDNAGRFISAGFSVETPTIPTGAVGQAR